MAVECEAKIKVENLGAVRARLRHYGAVDEGEVLERNWVFDTGDSSLLDNGILLRVRNTGDVGGVFTVKHAIDGGEFKCREEVESMVDSTDDLMRQLEILGYKIQWIYEKRRWTWLWHDCVIALDTCPEIGTYVEIEGEADRIREVASSLGLDPDQHICDSYLALWQKHLAERGEESRHMVFTDDKK